MSGTERCQQAAHPQPPSPELVLAAVERAARHRPGDGAGAPTRAVVEHLELPRRSAAARRVGDRLRALAEDGGLEASRRHGVASWELTPAGERRLSSARAAGTLPALPESPQHRAWRRARMAAALEIDRFRARLAGELADAQRMLDEDAAPGSDAWFELGERLARGCRLVGSASHCLREWPEPSEDRADVDEHVEPGEESLEEGERARRRARRRGRRNIALWTGRA